MLGYVISDGDGQINRILAEMAQRLQALGHVVGGVVQENIDRADGRACDMDLLVLPQGPRVRISQDLGAGAKGCRLNAQGLEHAAGLVASQLTDVDIIVINRFGKQEAEGRGFRPLIGAALVQGIPVVIALRPEFLPAFTAFAIDLGTPLAADPQVLTDWVATQLAEIVA